MEEIILDTQFNRIHKNLPFLWEAYGFHLKYFTRSYGIYHRGFIIGLENDICKMVFEKETDSMVEPIRIYIGTLAAQFRTADYSHLPTNGWYTITGLTYWLTGIECERYKDIDQDLENIGRYLTLYMERLIGLFKFPEEFDSKLQYYKKLYKGNIITVQRIREERARLQSLGQDSSLEAAITNLRGGKNE